MKNRRRDISRSSGKVLIHFDHGLGDIINFLPVLTELEKQTKKKITLSTEDWRQFHLIYSRNRISPEDFMECRKSFGYVYRIYYPEAAENCGFIEHTKEHAKPYLCAYQELGMKPFAWEPFNFKFKREVNEKRVGVHFFGNSSAKLKFCPIKTANKIWKEIEEAGFEPFEVHQPVKSKWKGDDEDLLEGINETNSIRHRETDLKLLFDELAKCKYFFGVDSGVFYLALPLLGRDNVCFLRNKKNVSMYVPIHINQIDVADYEDGSILNYFENFLGVS